jgi:Family of unknown function (DUF6483)
MIRRDYIIRMIEEFIQVLARIQSLKKGQLWREADGLIDEEFNHLVGGGAQVVAQLNETELLAKLIQGEPTQVVHHKTLVLTTLLKEAGDLAVAQDHLVEGRMCYLKGLSLLLHSIARGEQLNSPDFVPKVDVFVESLQNSPLPLALQVRLMQHYEQIGAFGKAEDVLFAMLETEPKEPRILDFGINFYQRLKNQSDTNLSAGNLPRAELETGMAELKRRKAGLSRL